eukprot:1720404-Pyramimonas_sp.AAC.1
MSRASVPPRCNDQSKIVGTYWPAHGLPAFPRGMPAWAPMPGARLVGAWVLSVCCVALVARAIAGRCCC